MRRILTALIVVGLAVPLGACDDGATGGDTSNMSLKLTDAPAGDLANAWVEITRIDLQGTAGSTTLMDESTGLVDLLTLAGTTKDLVSDVVVPSGEYSQLRIFIGAAAVKTEDGDVFSRGGAASTLGETKTGELTCPSCTETGIKVNLPGGSVTLESESKIIVLDFEVSESFGREAGFADQWVMKPLISTSEFGVTGNVSGTVSTDGSFTFPSCGGRATGVSDFVPQVTGPASADNPDTHSGDVAQDGSYDIQFLEPGDYDSGFASQVTIEGDVLNFSANADATTVTVEEGTTSALNFTITDATCSSS